MNNELVFTKEIKGKEIPITTSRQVAEKFEKEHKHVRRDIKKLISEISPNLDSSNYFVESTYKDNSNRTQDEYLLTRDGFTLLAMGFTGSKALEFKVKYIDAFNKMEEYIKNNKPQMSEKDRLLLNLFSNDPIVVSSSHKKLVELEVKEATTPLLETIEEQKPKAEFYDDVAGSSDAIAMGEVAKVLKIKGYGRNNLFEFLRNKKVLQRNNQPYQKYIDLGYFRVVETKFNKPNGDIGINIKTLVYQKGLDYIRRLVLKEVGEN